MTNVLVGINECVHDFVCITSQEKNFSCHLHYIKVSKYIFKISI